MAVQVFRRVVFIALPISISMLLAVPASGIAQAIKQGENDTYTLSVSAQVVMVPVSVRDSKGKLVQTLTKDDFTLTENGRPETIKYLTVDRNRPLNLALMVDTSGSQRDLIKKERAASDAFFNTLLTKEGDTAFLVRFDNAITMLQKPTESKADLQAALEHLEDPHPPRPEPPAETAAEYLARPAQGTLFYDALFLTCSKGMQDVNGRNAVVVLTDGDDRGSGVTLDATIDAAQRSNTVIYSILYSAERGVTEHVDGKKMSGKEVLQKLSSETGGHMFEVSAREPLEKIFDEISQEMRLQYVLVYSPTMSDDGPGFRKIELKARDKSWKIQTRSGYYYTGTMGDDE
jgi:VWFA-related protein